MRGCAIDAFGGPEKLLVRDLPVPSIDVHEVLVRVDTAGIGPWDVKARRGAWADGSERFPLILGADGSGTIAAVGAGVHGFQVGDAVYGFLAGERKGGFYAEFVAISAEHVAPVPAGLDFREAGGLPVAGITALAGIDDALGVRSGQTLLVHGATGGVGSAAVQFAQRRGARVIATARGAEGVHLLDRLGVDLAIDVLHEDIVGSVRRASPGGVDALLALAGGHALERALDALRPGGRAAYPNGVTFVQRDGIDARAFDGVPSPTAFARLTATVEAGDFEMPIAGTFALENAEEAHRRLERGRVHGKIVLAVAGAEDAIANVA